MAINAYARRLRALLSPDEHVVFKKLTTPAKVQDYLDTLPINFEQAGETLLSPCQVIERHTAHCIEGALFAAASLAYHGYRPLLMDFQTLPHDEDHVVAVFKHDGLWGAISKTNHAVLRWRDPLYRSPRELAMSYYHEYFEWDGTKTLQAYSQPFDLRRYVPERWVTPKEPLWWLAEDLDASKHMPVASKRLLKQARSASPIEIKTLTVVEWPDSRKKARK